jgi:hypothetical protein
MSSVLLFTRQDLPVLQGGRERIASVSHRNDIFCMEDSTLYESGWLQASNPLEPLPLYLPIVSQRSSIPALSNRPSHHFHLHSRFVKLKMR